MAVIYPKSYFKNKTLFEIALWYEKNYARLEGSCIATNSDDLISDIIQTVTKRFSRLNGFIPSHIGSIVNREGVLYVFDMKPTKAKLTPLYDYITSSNDNFVIVIREFLLNAHDFSKAILKLDGLNYGYFSAFQCAFKGISWIPNRKLHCSEIHPLYLQKQGYFNGVKCDDLTPVECYEKLVMDEVY